MNINETREMKFFLITLCIFLNFYSFAQEKKTITDETVNTLYSSLPKVDGKYEISEIVQLDSSFKKDILYRNTKLFFVDEFKSAKDVLQYDDKEEGKVIGKGNIRITGSQNVFLSSFTETWIVNFSLELFCKDGKYKYRIYDISIGSRLHISDSHSPDNTSELSIDDAFKETQKSALKKMYKRMFTETIDKIYGTTVAIKKYLSQKSSSSSSDF